MSVSTRLGNVVSLRRAAPLVSGVLVGGSAVLVLSAALSASAQSTASGAALAEQYLAALKPAGVAISTVESRLEKLPVTATVAQVKAAVAPLPKALAQLEALSSHPSPSPGAAGATLQGLGKPRIYGANAATCNSYGSPAAGARLVVGGTEYPDGFQMTTPGACQSNPFASYSWHLGTAYRTLSMQVGYDLSNACKGTYVNVLGNNGSKLPFTFKGKIIEALHIPAKGLASISVDIARQDVLTVQANFTCADGFLSLYGASSVIDVVNDHLSS